MAAVGVGGRAAAASEALAALTPLQSAEEPEIAEAAKAAVAEIERSRAMWAQLQKVWFGLSLGSVLLLAAVGLAITFGVMGVINMAHGELIMLGAYTTFVIQEADPRRMRPASSTGRCSIAAPAAFLVAGGIGVAIERGDRALPLRPAAGDAARDLGREPDPAAGGADGLRAVEPRGGQPVVDVGVGAVGRDAGHLEPLLHHHLRAGGLRGAAGCCSGARPSGCRCGR